MRWAGSLALASFLILAFPAHADDVEDPIRDDVAAPEIVIPVEREKLDICFDSNARVHAGDYSVSVPSYPCEVMRTYETLDKIEDKTGPLVALVRVFLKTRLVMRGVGSSLFGFFQLG